MLGKPTYLDFLKITYQLHLTVKPKKNGNYGLTIFLRVGDVSSYYYLTQNVLKIFIENWRYYFSTKGVELMRRRNGAVYLNSFPESVIQDLENLDFYRYKSRYLARKNNIEYKKAGSNIKELDNLFFTLFKYDTSAQEVIETADLFNHV